MEGAGGWRGALALTGPGGPRWGLTRGGGRRPREEEERRQGRRGSARTKRGREGVAAGEGFRAGETGEGSGASEAGGEGCRDAASEGRVGRKRGEGGLG